MKFSKILLYIFFNSLIFSVLGQNETFLQQEIEKTTINLKNRKTNIEEHQLIMPEDIIDLYENNGFSALWWWNGRLNVQVNEALAVLSSSYFEGLNPADYHYEELIVLKKTINEKEYKNNVKVNLFFELLLTDGLLTYAYHLYRGKVDQKQVSPTWFVDRNKSEINFSSYLLEAKSHFNLTESFENLKPMHMGYTKLKWSLQYYRDLNSIYSSADLDNSGYTDGKDDPFNNAWIADRLRMNGFLINGINLNVDSIKSAIAQFKKTHGLGNNSEIDFKVIQELNITIESRINTILANLERWRWLPSQFEDHYVLVNIPDYNLKVIIDNKTVSEHNVIVGRPTRKTPVLSTKILGVIIHPYWIVPPTILKEDILPLKGKVPSYLYEHNMQVLDNEFNVIPIDSIDWNTINPNQFPYLLRQRPGSNNALGNIKFNMPNSRTVYLHDTPSRNLFSEQYRAFSSGCIRVEKPFDLAGIIFEYDHSNTSKIYKAIERKNTKYFDLKSPWKAYILYWTAWVDDQEKINFREDVYDRDQALIRQLKAPPEPHLPK